MKKLIERAIDTADVKSAVEAPSFKENDKADPNLIHFIREKEGRYLRIVGRFLNRETFWVVSAFYDRRLKKGKDKNAQH